MNHSHEKIKALESQLAASSQRVAEMQKVVDAVEHWATSDGEGGDEVRYPKELALADALRAYRASLPSEDSPK